MTLVKKKPFSSPPLSQQQHKRKCCTF